MAARIELRPNGRGGQQLLVDGEDISDKVASDGFLATVESGHTQVRITRVYLDPDLTIETEDGVTYSAGGDRG